MTLVAEKDSHQGWLGQTMLLPALGSMIWKILLVIYIVLQPYVNSIDVYVNTQTRMPMNAGYM